MSEKYLPSTPLEARVRAGHFGEAIMPPAGVQPGPVYVYTAGIRIWHWVTTLAIIVLADHRVLHRLAAAVHRR